MQDRYEQAEASGRIQHLQDWDVLEGLIVSCRNAAALQPDGTKQPVLRCEVRPFLFMRCHMLVLILQAPEPFHPACLPST